MILAQMHTVDTSTTHTGPAVIHISGQVKRAASQFALPPAKVQKHHAVTLDNFVMQTSASEKVAIDIQIIRFICTTNSPFSIAEHPESIKRLSMLRPGYSPPNRQRIGNQLLNEVCESMQSECKDRLKDQNVSMMLDGSSNVHNEPIACVFYHNTRWTELSY